MSAGEFYQMFAGLGDGFMKGYEFGNKLSDRRRAREQEATLAQMLAGMTGGNAGAPTVASGVAPAKVASIDPSALGAGVATKYDPNGPDRAKSLAEYVENGSLNGLRPDFQVAALAFLNDNPYGVGIRSGVRTRAQQQALWDRSDKTGRMVARPGNSRHEHGTALDLSYEIPEARKWALENAGAYGLRFPMSYEPWHVEPIGARSGGAPAGQAIQQAAPAGAPQQVAQAPQQAMSDAPAMAMRPRPTIDPRLLMGILNNPQSGAGAKAIAQTLLAKQFESKDPMAQMKMALEIQKLQAEMGRPNTEIIRDAATGEILSVDRNNPAAGVQTLRKAGPSKDAPTTRQIKQADGSEVVVQWNAENRKWEPMQAPEGGAAVRAPNKLTEQQSKDIVYYNRGRQALETLGAGEVLASGYEAGKGYVPVVGNYLTSGNFQKAQQAATNFLMSILRKDTGAAITKQEEEIYGRIFLPKPGDAPETLAQKAQARAQALDAIRDGLGPAEVLAIGERFVPRSGGAPAKAQPSSPAPSRLPPGKSTTINGVKIERVE